MKSPRYCRGVVALGRAITPSRSNPLRALPLLALAGASVATPASAQSPVNLTNSPTTTEQSPIFSPTGTLLAVQQLEASGAEKFLIFDVDAETLAYPPRNSVAETMSYSWSPDETEIVFQEKPHGAPSRIKVWTLATGGARDIGSGYEPVWSDSGTPGNVGDDWIYFTDGSCSSTQIARIRPDGTSRSTIVSGSALGDVIVSPDGRYLGFTGEVGCSGAQPFSVFVRDLVTGVDAYIGNNPNGWQRPLGFTPSSDQVFWASGYLPTLCSRDVAGGATQCDVQGQLPGKYGFGGNANQAFSPDGTRFLLITGDVANTSQHQVQAFDTTARSYLSTVSTYDGGLLFADATACAWSPRGDAIAFVGRKTADMTRRDLYLSRTNAPPTACYGGPTVVDESSSAWLDSSCSTDDGAVVAWSWMQLGGPAATIVDPTAETTVLVAPAVDWPTTSTTLTFGLTVTDDDGATDTEVVNITVRFVNLPPEAHAIAPIAVDEGSTVLLDGSGSFDHDNQPLAHSWEALAGSGISIVDASSPTASFIAPLVGPAGATYAFQLTVSDGDLADTDVVLVTVVNVDQPPTANAGLDQTVFEGELVALSGDGDDPDGDALEFEWEQTSGPAVVLSDPATPAPTFTAPAVGPGGVVLTFALTVSDGELDSDPSNVTVTVMDANDPPACALAIPSVAAIWPPNHKLVPIQIRNVTDPNDDQVAITITAVTQDEPTNGLGDGDTPVDAVISGSSVLLRAERSGTGNGRVYVIHFVADDGEGGTCSGSVRVTVPRSQRGDPAVDSGQNHDSLH